MGARLYIGNISFKTKEDSLREHFARVGEVVSVRLVTDPHTGQLKGFGFAETASPANAKKASQKFNGTVFLERSLTVNEAKPRKSREQRDFSVDGVARAAFTAAAVPDREGDNQFDNFRSWQ
jgi:RNA recognition motif-containing protein